MLIPPEYRFCGQQGPRQLYRNDKKEEGVYVTMTGPVVPEAKEALNKFKMEAANEVGVNLKDGYNGHLTSKEAGSVGGQMVKKMIESYEKGMK